MKYTGLIILSFWIYALSAQNGHLYITNFDIDEKHSHHRINDIKFNESNVAFIANKYGVASFNGMIWNKIDKIPSNVIAMKIDTSTNHIYLGLKNEIGYLKPTINGVFEYHKIHAFKKEIGDFSQVTITNQLVVFYNDKSINLIEKTNPAKIVQFNSKDYGNFAGIFQFNNKVFVNIRHKGLFEIYNLNLKKFGANKLFKDERIRFYTSYNKTKIILGTSSNRIYLFDGNKFVQFAEFTEIRNFLDDNILWDGIDLSPKYFAVSTLNGGCAVIDKIYGKIVYIIDHNSGLPDDEIFDIAIDKNNGLWLAHEKGLSRCDINLPIRNYSSYAGLSGAINDILRVKNKVYVATNNGVYILQNQDRQNYGYLKVDGINEKCKQLFNYNGNVFTSTNYGLFLIEDSSAEILINDEYVNDVCKDKKENLYYVATLNGMYSLSFENDFWKAKKVFNNFDKPVYSVVEDRKGNLFIGSNEKAFFAKRTAENSFSQIQNLPHTEKIYEPIHFMLINDSVYDIQSEGVFKYDKESHSILYTNIDHITLENIPFILSGKNAWINVENQWTSVNKSKKIQDKELLLFFSQIKRFYQDKQNNTWIIEKGNELVKIDHQSKNGFSKELFLDIYLISDKKDSLYSTQNPMFEYQDNAMRFEFIAPFYLKSDEIQYQYFVEGLKNYDSWSKWSKNGFIELSSVPAGQYILKAKAKNIFNSISNQKEIHFTILTPFWQTRWFLTTLSVLGLFIIGLTFYFANRRLIRKQQILEKKVKERTVALRKEKNKTETLLLNILPKETAEELKTKNKVKPQNYDKVTILFTDFKGFTKIAETMTPVKLVSEIDYCFRAFDQIISKYKIEKIKTIGDAYMCAGGLPTKNPNNAFDVVKAALDIRNFMLKYQKERKSEGKPFFEIRIGINTGKVVAGVVGTKKYAYDIWGDAVNLASRMESSGEVGKVNISGSTYKIVRYDFDCTHRGKIEAKNKGEVDMYFVEKKS
jgi:class 3 adenylate cyclase